MTRNITVIGTGGARLILDADQPWVAAQLAAGQLTPADSSSHRSAASGTGAGDEQFPSRPSTSAAKREWVAHIVATTDLTQAEAEDLTRAELIALTEEG